MTNSLNYRPVPFLTDLDSRAEVKGSRDPLGLVPVWARAGREVVGNLTTVTGSVRGFTTLLLGLHFANMLQERFRADAPSVLSTFLKFEQMAGYARVSCNEDRDVRGTQRVVARLREKKRLRISAQASDQILSDQKTYGLWGLFSVPARASEMLVPGEQRLTPEAQLFVERHYFPLLGNRSGVNALLDLLRKEDGFDLEVGGRHADLMTRIGNAHSKRLRSEERAFYREHLAWGGPTDSTNGRQRALAEILTNVAGPEFGFREFRLVQKQSRSNEPLAAALEKIEKLERLIAPAAMLFGFLQSRDGQLATSVARELVATWKRPLALDLEALRRLQPQMAAALQSKDEAGLWIALAQALAGAEYIMAIERLVAINTSVMQRRHGAASWIALENGIIRIRLGDERAELTPVEEAEDSWRSTYFINSLWAVARAVRSSST